MKSAIYGMKNIVAMVVAFLRITSDQQLQQLCGALASNFFDISFMWRIDGPFRLRSASKSTRYTPIVYSSLEDNDLEQMVFQLARWVVLSQLEQSSVPTWPLTCVFEDCTLTITERLNIEVVLVLFVNRYPSLHSGIASFRQRVDTLLVTQAADETTCIQWTELMESNRSITLLDIFLSLRWPGWILLHEEAILHPMAM